MTDEVPDRPNPDPAWPSADEIAARIAQLDLTAELEADGLPYSELDVCGGVVTHNPQPPEAG
jgi:hypothetical protein